MKKVLIGLCLILCGVVFCCVEYMTLAIVDAMPNARITGQGPGYAIAIALILLGAAVTWKGYTEDN